MVDAGRGDAPALELEGHRHAFGGMPRQKAIVLDHRASRLRGDRDFTVGQAREVRETAAPPRVEGLGAAEDALGFGAPLPETGGRVGGIWRVERDEGIDIARIPWVPRADG